MIAANQSCRLVLDMGRVALPVFVYRPARVGRLLLVFHGVLRNAEAYRDDAIALAERTGALVAAPHFEEAAFPFQAYQLGGIVRDGAAVPAEERTGALADMLADALRARAGLEGMPHDLLGHSGGGQFLGRLAAFVPGRARRIVAANPGTYTFPTREAPFPYGFGGLPPALASDEALRAYLARPLAIYLGTADLERDEDFNTSPEAEKQGASRHARGRAAFAAAQALAAARGWPCAWTLVEAEGVGHDHAAMFDHPACLAALGW